MPIIAGVTTNIRHTLIWSYISTMTIIAFMLAQSRNLFPPSVLNPEANWLINAMPALGLIALISGFTVFILMLDKKATDQQRQKALSKATKLQTLSHDIANPLTVISGLLDIKSADELQLDRDKTKLLRNNTKKIRQIINSVRRIESVDSGKGNLELTGLGLSACLEVAASTVEPNIRAKKLTLELEARHKQKVLVHKEIIENHIITSVLTNAVKFSPEGSTITIKVPVSKDFVEMIISDRGVGIPTNLIPHLFDLLIATTRLGTAGGKGTGFGLPIVQKFMKLMHGRVEISSQQKTDSSKTHGTDVKLYFKRRSHA